MNEKTFKNYEIFKKKTKRLYLFKKFDIKEVDLLDNNLFIKKKNIGRDIFDENYFLFLKL